MLNVYYHSYYREDEWGFPCRRQHVFAARRNKLELAYQHTSKPSATQATPCSQLGLLKACESSDSQQLASAKQGDQLGSDALQPSATDTHRQSSEQPAAMPLKAVKTAKFAVLDAGGLKQPHQGKLQQPRPVPAASARRRPPA